MKGILFKPDMIKAIVERRKTQTRRVIKDPTADLLLNRETVETIYKPRYQVGETVYIKEAWWNNGFKGTIGTHYKSTCELDNPPWKWKSPLFMPAWAARYFIKIIGVRAERLNLPLSPEELSQEGGEEALTILEKISGLWVWVYTFKLQDKEVKRGRDGT